MKICKVIFCGRKHEGLGYCSKHRQQFKRHGRIFRSTYDSNKIIKKGKIALIELYNKKGDIKAITKIDSEDINLVKDYKWCCGDGYVKCINKKLRLHNLIMGKKWIDHKNLNPLDNRKENLRPATQSQQNMNQGMKKNNTSGHRGISLCGHKAKNGKYYYYWVAEIRINGKKIVLGSSKDKNKMIKLRKEAEKKYFKEYAPKK